jgi:hypothetical protein
MGASTGPLLAVGGVTMFNQTVLHKQPPNWRVAAATGFAVAAFALIEKGGKAGAGFAKYTAWIALLTVLLARVDPKTPSPVETLLAYWNKGGG